MNPQGSEAGTMFSSQALFALDHARGGGCESFLTHPKHAHTEHTCTYTPHSISLIESFLPNGSCAALGNTSSQPGFKEVSEHAYKRNKEARLGQSINQSMNVTTYLL